MFFLAQFDIACNNIWFFLFKFLTPLYGVFQGATSQFLATYRDELAVSIPIL